MEFQFVDKFNEITEGLQMMFPNAKIYGNYDDLEYYGCFDVYIHGIGPFFDNKGRYFLFKKNARGRYLWYMVVVLIWKKPKVNLF